MAASKPTAVRIWLEDTFGVIPTSPKAYLINAKALNIEDSQAKQRNNEFGNDGEASSPTYGATDNTVSMTLVMGNANVPLINELVYGKAQSGGVAASGAWTLTTAYAVGDIVSHSNGTQDLICLVAGASDGTEPVITTLGDNDTIVDATVTWIVYRTLYSFIGQNIQCPTSFGIEIEETDCSGAMTYRRATGCRINTSPAGQTGDATSYDMTLDGFGQIVTDSDNPSFTYTKIEDEAGYTEVDLRVNEFFNYEDSTFEIDDVPSTKVIAYNMTCSRGVSYENLLNQSKQDNVGTIDPTGTIDAYFETALWQTAANHTDFKATMTWAKDNGSSYICINPQVKADRPNKTFDTEMSTKISGLNIDAYGTPTSPSVTYNIVSPTPYPL